MPFGSHPIVHTDPWVRSRRPRNVLVMASLSCYPPAIEAGLTLPQCDAPVSRGETRECEMLVLSRKVGERILVGDQVRITVVRITSGGVRLGIEVPYGTTVVREELTFKLLEDQPAAGQSATADRGGCPSECSTERTGFSRPTLIPSHQAIVEITAAGGGQSAARHASSGHLPMYPAVRASRGSLSGRLPSRRHVLLLDAPDRAPIPRCSADVAL